MIELYNGDCLDIMLQLENNSFDCATLSDCIIQVYDSRLYFIKEYRKKSVEFKAQDWNDFLKYIV